MDSKRQNQRPPAVLRVIVALAVGVVGLSVLFRPLPAHACSCALTGAQARSRADVIFTGTVTARQDPNVGARIQSSADPIRWVFAVDTITRGTVANPQPVLSARAGASCGFTFVVGARYEVAARRDGGVLRAGLCSGTHAVPADPSVKPLPTTTPIDLPARAHQAVQSASPALLIVGLALAALAAIGLASNGLRRR